MTKIPKLCSTHPQYQGKRKPRYRCATCWAIWTATKYDLKAKDVRDIMAWVRSVS